MRTQSERADHFKALHDRPGAFVLPNPWDAGSARILAAAGFEALATTSFGAANILGRTTITPQQILDNCQLIVDATDLPVNADLENCGADDPKTAATMITRAAEVGVVAGSIEDATGDPARPIYEFSLSVERVHAAVEAARRLPFPFLLTARAENLLHGQLDLDALIRRLQAFETVGADVLYAPGLKTLAVMQTVVQAIGKPLNVVMSHADTSLSVADLAGVGVKRISVGGSLSRYALSALMQAADEMRGGRFSFIASGVSAAKLRNLFKDQS